MRSIGLIFLLLYTAVPVVAQHVRLPVENWTVRSESGEIGPVEAPVPGVIHTALLEAGLIPDPYFGDNEQRVAWVDSTTWVYETILYIPPLMEQPELVFDGLDTVADVYVDGELVLSAENMFRQWRVPLDPTIEAFDLRVVFHSAAVQAEQRASTYPYPLPESPRMFVRKAAYHFGWDWGPRFVTAGLWKGVFLEDHSRPRLEGTYLRTLSVSDERADVELVATVQNIDARSATVVARLNGEEMVRSTVELDQEHEISLPFSVDRPRLWWPSGSGEPYLYNLEVNVSADNRTTREQLDVGIRTIELETTGGSLQFVVNGELLFIKGANSTPLTSFHPASEVHQRTVLQAAADANMNMIRVWGGGVYEDDLFYDLADSLGIMVWQDFMFANALYPDTEEFLDNVRNEAKEQVVRLRRHPSIVLWCGNNEIIEGWHNWGWQESLGYSEADSLALLQGYRSLFEELLPEVVGEHQPELRYWPSSPSNGWGRDIAYEEGDVHYWGVWWGREPFESYREKIGRFNSEYGFQAYPVESTVRTFADSLTEESTAFRNHQKHPHGFEWLREYAEMTFGHVPEDPDLWRYMTQVMQAEGVGMAIAGHRANKPRTMGTLYWQLNDVWPVVSWSSMDVFGRWKPLHYRVRDLYQPLFAEVYQEGDSLRLRVVSDSREPVYAEANIQALDTHAGLVWMDRVDVSLGPNGVADIDLGRRDVIDISDERLVLRIHITDADEELLSTMSTILPRWEVDLAPPDISGVLLDGMYWVAPNRLALGIWIEDAETGTNLSPNYVDLLPNESIGFELPASVHPGRLVIRSIYDLQRR